MLHQYFRDFLLIIIFSSCATNSIADVVTGNLSDPNVTWTASGNPWIIRAPDINNPIQEITVGAATTLTIEPGVIVQVDGAISIRVLGTLIAQGTVDNPIRFESFDPNLTWRFIEFTNSSAPAVFVSGNYVSGSILEYVNISSAGSRSFGNAFANGILYLNGGRPFINNVNISNGTASGVFIQDINNVLKITSTTISNNHDASGTNGGGITISDQLTGANIEISNCNISGNSTTIDGGGIFINGDVDTLTITDNTISDNVSGNNGGGLFISNLAGLSTNYQIERNLINSNIAERRGGGVVVENSNVTLYDNRIVDNSTNQDDGGGVFLSVNATVDLDSNVIMDNVSGFTGGGIYVGLGEYFGPIMGNNINIINNIIANNNASTRGGGIYVEEDTITITDNVIADNTAGVTSSALQVEAGGSLARNTITRNTSNAIITIADAQQGGTTALNVQDNTIVNNDAAIDVILNSSGGGTGMLALIGANNIVDNGPGFYLTNTVIGAGNMTASNNYFAVTDPVLLAANISGLITYDPVATTVFEDPAPVAPPTNVVVTNNGSSVTLNWDASPETDVTSYTVYWGNQQAPLYENSASAGLLTSYTISGLDPSNNLYFAVTASDNMAGTDDPATTVNERQVSGHESWFSEEQAILVSTGSGGGGGGGGFGWFLICLFPFLLYRNRIHHLSTP